MLKKNLCGLFAALFAAGFAGCGGGPRTYTVVDGTMLGTTLHVVADVEGVSSQELYAAVMELDREAKASMSIFDPASVGQRDRFTDCVVQLLFFHKNFKPMCVSIVLLQ